MQEGIRFATVDDFLEFLPDEEREIVDVLRELTLQSIPDVTEKLAYNVPYYYRHSRICFIWPAAVPWGNVKMDGVAFGFCHGNLIQDDSDFLEKGRRKQVYTKTYHRVSDIDAPLLRSFIEEAVSIDDSLRSS